MTVREATTARTRVLLITDDDTYSTELKSNLPAIDVLSLTEASVWLAVRAGLDVTRSMKCLLLDRGVSGRLQLHLYERMRPQDAVAGVPVIFTRSKLTAAMSGFSHDLDFYQQEDGTPDAAARLLVYVLGIAGVPGEAAPEVAVPAAAAVASRGRRWTGGAGKPLGLLQRLGLWGVAAALIGFTFWPLLGSGPLRDAVQGPFTTLSSASSLTAGGPASARTAR